MMIGIDGNEANINNRVGVNKYAFAVIWGLYNKLNKSKEPISITVYLKNQPLSDMPQENSRFKYRILPGGKVWIITRLMPELFFGQKPDVFFSPSHYLPLFAPMPLVFAIMDLGYLEFSAQFRKYDYWQLKLWTARSISVSKYITTISNSSKEDILRHYPYSKGKVVVTYPGVDNLTVKTLDIERVRSKYSIVNPYVLYLGTLKPSKNIEGLILAWGKIVNKYPDFKLVIGGKKGWLYDSIFRKVTENNLAEKIIFTDFVAENDKAALIKGAEAFVMPSFWEGFGLDILSAFKLQIPVVASEVGSLPEVIGDAGILVDPNNIDSIASGIEKTLNMTRSEHDKIIEKQQEQLKKFSWEKTADKILEVLKKANKQSL